MYLANETQFQSLGQIGEQWDRKVCYEARDTYFNCLDDNQLLQPNPFKCSNSHELWEKSCNDAWRRQHVADRVRNARDHKNFNQEALNEYNHQMNQHRNIYQKKVF